MAKITLYEKNFLDKSFTAPTIVITDGTATDLGNDIVNFMRDRSNNTGHATTDSDDAGLTRYDVDLVDGFQADTIALLNHNFDSLTLQKFSGAGFGDFSNPIALVGNTKTSNFFEFGEVTPNLYRLIVQGTIIPDADKLLSQFIITKRIGTFDAEPDLEEVIFDEGKIITNMVSNRRHIARRAGAANVVMTFPPNRSQNDINLIKRWYDSNTGLLVSFVGGDDSNIGLTVRGWRSSDLFLMAPLGNYDTAWEKGRFAFGQKNSITLAEVL